jgi:hypothetical protein
MGILSLPLLYRNIAALLANFTRETLTVLLGLGLFLAGVVGIEIISYQFLRDGSSPSLYLAAAAAEEFLEMAGITTALYGTILFAIHKQEKAAFSKLKVEHQAAVRRQTAETGLDEPADVPEPLVAAKADR